MIYKLFADNKIYVLILVFRRHCAFVHDIISDCLYGYSVVVSCYLLIMILRIVLLHKRGILK